MCADTHFFSGGSTVTGSAFTLSFVFFPFVLFLFRSSYSVHSSRLYYFVRFLSTSLQSFLLLLSFFHLFVLVASSSHSPLSFDYRTYIYTPLFLMFDGAASRFDASPFPLSLRVCFLPCTCFFRVFQHSYTNKESDPPSSIHFIVFPSFSHPHHSPTSNIWCRDRLFLSFH